MTDIETEPHNAEYPYGKPRWSTPRPVPVNLKPVNGFALVSFFLALFGISIPAIITGHVALYQLSFINMERGKTLAWIGLVLGYLQTIIWIALIVMFAVQVIAVIGTLGTTMLLAPGSSGSSDTSSAGGISELLRQLEQLSEEAQ